MGMAALGIFCSWILLSPAPFTNKPIINKILKVIGVIEVILGWIILIAIGTFMWLN